MFMGFHEFSCHFASVLVILSCCHFSEGLQNLTAAEQRSKLAACHTLYLVVFQALGTANRRKVLETLEGAREVGR